MIAGNFPAFATEGIFDPHGRIYKETGCELSGRPLPVCESSADLNNDVALVTAVLQKDRKATADFVNTYTDAVYSFIHRRLSPRHDLVDDLVQEVFIAAWENLGSFRGTSPLRAWLLGIARHKIEDYYRRLSNRRILWTLPSLTNFQTRNLISRRLPTASELRSAPVRCSNNCLSITAPRFDGATGKSAVRAKWLRRPGAPRRGSSGYLPAPASSSGGGGWHERGFASAVAAQVQNLFRAAGAPAEGWTTTEPL